ncbi:MATE family efflux transporter [Aliidiomarina halalkaliphila]|uniref:Multidrug-efflux transporter n=1 Tax=Aliidiomarina halalkaliphila TaxID=2593535 RepID=A0A552X513_9GAMM|nr:MATE family efflux transporter [Aliidiomarina halalkaliphila]TRW50111.1 MATE family efflux transporter [Aliidiomarina halalkaliphila]
MRHLWPETKKLALLTGPILIAQLTQMLMGVVDTLMAGRVGATDLAAVAVGSAIWIPLTLLVFGMGLALAPVISHCDGAGERSELGRHVQQSFYTCVIAAVLTGLLLLLAPYFLVVMDVEPAFRTMTMDYLRYILWGLPAFVVYVVLRNFCEGLSHTMPSLVIGVIGLIINIPANYIFIYGKFGMPALGGAGAGVASAIVLWGMAASLLLYVLFSKRYRRLKLLQVWHLPNWDDIWHFVRLGFPISMALFFETSLFAAVAILIAPLGTIMVSGHQIALNVSSLVYMVPLSLSMAVTLRVGFALGAQKPEDAMNAYKIAMFMGVTFAAINGLGMWLGGQWLASLYTDNREIIELAGTLLALAAIFTVSDTFQAISIGALRGYKDTRASMIVTLIAYWPFGLSVGVVLGLTDWVVPRMGAAGFWIGFISGLSVAAVLLTIRLFRVHRRWENTIPPQG